MIHNSIRLRALKIFCFSVLMLYGGIAEMAEAQRSIIPSLGNSRAGTSGFQFLKINPDARSAALGNSNVADAMDASSLYLNPALAAQSPDQVFLGHTAYFADINLNYASYIKRKRGMAFGGSVMYLDSGEMNETTEFAPTGTGRVFRTTHLAVGLTFAQELTSLFSYGITAKYINEGIEEITSQTVVFDIGFFYRVGDTGLRFAVGLSNFSVDAAAKGITFRPTLNGLFGESDPADISPPTMFTVGAAYDAYSNDSFDVIITSQLINPSDNAERFSVGAEVVFIDQFYLRTGYEFGVDEAILPSAGVGFKVPVFSYNLGLDYAFSTRERLGSMHRLALKFNL